MENTRWLGFRRPNRVRRIVPPLVVLVCWAAATHAQGGWFWSEIAELTADDPAGGDMFGWSVALEGDTALLGARWDDDLGGNSGSAYVLVRSGASWSEEAKLLAPAGAALEEFGHAVAFTGNTALVAAPGSDAVGTDAGAAHVFTRTGTSWTHQALLTGATATDAAFGSAVALHGDTILIGAEADDIGGGATGAAYVFVRAGSTWSLQARLEASDAEPDDLFGHSVSLSGDTVVIGAWAKSSVEYQAGAAYVFVRNGTTWSQQAKLTAFDPAWQDAFGYCVSLDGDRAVIGVPWDGKGSAYVFERTAGNWTLHQVLAAADDDYQWFGRAVTVEGDTVLAGAPSLQWTTGGAVYAFVRSGFQWTQQARLLPAVSTHSDQFGENMALDGDTALIGAAGKWNSFSAAGRAYVFAREAYAGASFRNVPPNPTSHRAVTLPVLDSTYTATVDLGGTTGHSFAWLMGYAAPLTLVLDTGPVLLIDIAHPAGELLGQGFRGGPVATWDLLMPSDSLFVGFEMATQALHFGGGNPFALSNAQDLFLGW